MVRHIVLFQLKKELSGSARTGVMENFKRGIESLTGQIEVIRHIEVGFNTNADEAWDICLLGDFEDLEAVRVYSADPRHQQVAGALKPYLSGRSCVDYER